MPRLRKRLKRARNEIVHACNLYTPPPKMPFGKAFVIGMPKTGTSSVRDFLKANGSRHLTIFRPVTDRWMVGDHAYLQRCIAHYNSFDDRPWNKMDMIERLMQRDTADRFILTIRDPNAWFDSRNRYNLRFGYPPTPEERRDETVETLYLLHYERCRALAKHYDKQILEIDVTQDKASAEKIADFLNLRGTQITFPHSNRNP